MPLDIEELRIWAATAPCQQTLPPGIVGAAYGHVVGHGVHDQAHAVLAQRLDQALQGRFAAQFRVDLRGIDDVVTVA